LNLPFIPTHICQTLTNLITLNGPAYEAISGLKLTAINYSEALAILKKRFGNKKYIIDKHMQTLVNVEAVTSQHSIKGLRRFYDLVESQLKVVGCAGRFIWHPASYVIGG